MMVMLVTVMVMVMVMSVRRLGSWDRDREGKVGMGVEDGVYKPFPLRVLDFFLYASSTVCEGVEGGLKRKGRWSDALLSAAREAFDGGM